MLIGSRNIPTVLSSVSYNRDASHISEFNATLQKYTLKHPENFAMKNALTYREEADNHAIILKGDMGGTTKIYRYFNPETDIKILHPELGDRRTEFHFKTERLLGNPVLVYQKGSGFSGISLRSGGADKKV